MHHAPDSSVPQLPNEPEELLTKHYITADYVQSELTEMTQFLIGMKYHDFNWLHVSRASSWKVLCTPDSFSKESDGLPEQERADAWKVVANCTAFPIPRPPECNGSGACVLALLLRLTFSNSLTMPLCSLSKECSRGEEKEGDERNTLKSLRMETACRRRVHHEHGAT